MVFLILSEVDKSFSVPEHTVYVTVGCIVHVRKTWNFMSKKLESE